MEQVKLLIMCKTFYSQYENVYNCKELRVTDVFLT